jgi:hypothetical protein
MVYVQKYVQIVRYNVVYDVLMTSLVHIMIVYDIVHAVQNRMNTYDILYADTISYDRCDICFR